MARDSRQSSRSNSRDIRRPEDWFPSVIRPTTGGGGGGGTYTDEQAQDAVGFILIDTATIDLTYNDAANTIKADVKAGSIGATELASTTVTPGSYTLTSLTVDADGRITAASNGVAYSNEDAQDAVGTILTDTATIDFTYNDAANTIIADVKASSIGSSQLVTADVNEIAQDAVGTILTDSTSIKFTYSDSTPSITADVKLPVHPGGRLTLVSLTPVMFSDQTAKGTVYYTPYKTDLLPLYDGSVWTIKSFTELTLTLNSSDNLVENVYDIYAFNDTGTLRIGTGPAWNYNATVTMTIATPCVVTWTAHGLNEGDPIVFTTSGALPTGLTAGTVYFVGRSPSANSFNVSTTRANAAAGTFIATSGTQSGTHTGTNNTRFRGTGAGTTELELKNGLLTNKNSITLKNNGTSYSSIAANKCLYVGSIYCTANGQTGMAYQPAAASGGSNNILGVYNAHNRVRTLSVELESTANWLYGLTTWRAANNSVSNRITWLDGLQESYVTATLCQSLGVSASTFSAQNGVNIDNTTLQPSPMLIVDASITACSTPVRAASPLLGVHYAQAMEGNSGAVNKRYFGNGYTLTLDVDM